MALGKIKEYGIGLTKAGLPQVVIEFEVEGEPRNVKWYGSLKEGKAREITLRTLIESCEFSGDDLSAIAQGIEGGALNHLKEYDVTAEDQSFEGGKTFRKISWINLPGAGKFKKVEGQEAVHLLKGYNFKDDIKALRAQVPVVKQTEDEDVPF